jgi:site-specific recombinase XerD
VGRRIHDVTVTIPATVSEPATTVSPYRITPEPARPATPVTSRFGDLSQAPADTLVDAVLAAWPCRNTTIRSHRRLGTRTLLDYLARFPGRSWQDRWVASGLDDGSVSAADVLAIQGPALPRAHRTTGVRSLFCLRVVQPSRAALDANKVVNLGPTLQVAEHDPLLDKFVEEVARSGRSVSAQREALFDVAAALVTQAIRLADLTPETLLHYALESRQLHAARIAPRTNRRLPGHVAWDVLAEMQHFPPGTPPRLRACFTSRQLTPTEIVDRYRLRHKEIRQLLIDYLSIRRPTCDYGSFARLAIDLVNTFWKAIEQLDPAQTNLRLPEATYTAWRDGLVQRPDGTIRLNNEAVLGTVRAFYLDIQQWAVEDPARWARWAAPCPISAAIYRQTRASKRRVNERTASRVRERQPLLPALVERVESERTRLAELLTAAAAANLGQTFTFRGRDYRRTDTPYDKAQAARGFNWVRVVDVEAGELIRVTAEEDSAFWAWVIVETLRLTGVRVEELLELTQLSIRQYARPNGEVIGLLVIAPSKTDRERVLPMSAELFHVIATIVRRLTRTSRSVPLVSRYDIYERTWSAPMPFLFQRAIGGLSVIAAGTVRDILQRLCDELADTREGFARHKFTPHDFRRLFVTDLVNSGLPIHIGAKLLGHLDLQTTQGYVAVFEEDLVRHYQDFLARRRAQRPADEYPTPTEVEWSEFEEHFDRRKVELGSCGRPYGTPCQHEHACVRCPVLHVDPKMLPRLVELERDLRDRRRRAEHEGWTGEIEGIDLTLRLLAEKKASAERAGRTRPAKALLGMPVTWRPESRGR